MKIEQLYRALKRVWNSSMEKRFLDESRAEALQGMSWREWYVHVYLCSDEWRDKREMVLERDGYTCQWCGRVEATQVHHLSYVRVKINNANERLSELISVCETCHHKIHNIKKEQS